MANELEDAIVQNLKFPGMTDDGLSNLSEANIFDMPTTKYLAGNATSDIYTTTTSDSRRTDQSIDIVHGIYRDQSRYFKDFNRYYQVYPDEEQSQLIEYVFIVRPDLNILEDDGLTLKGASTRSALETIYQDPTFRYLNADSPGLLKQLCNSAYQDREHTNGKGHDFISFLVGRTDSFSVSDYTLGSYDDSQLFTGFKFVYPGNANASQSGVSFDIGFRDDENLNLSKFFYAWCYYIDGELKGKYPPTYKYIGTKIADYMTSMYYFVCGPDGSEIKFFQKIVGCFPTGAPLSFYSMNMGGGIDSPKISIPFTGAMPESMNPLILYEFNKNSGIYDMKTQSFKSNITGDWISKHVLSSYDKNLRGGVINVGKPFIITGTKNNALKYYLVWEDPYSED